MGEIRGINAAIASKTVALESGDGRGNVWWRGEQFRDQKEHRLRRQLTKFNVTLRHERGGRKKNKIPQ